MKKYKIWVLDRGEMGEMAAPYYFTLSYPLAIKKKAPARGLPFCFDVKLRSALDDLGGIHRSVKPICRGHIGSVGAPRLNGEREPRKKVTTVDGSARAISP